jgi:TRAP-type C4-dicarboxylate transport system substrate-binding protein
VYQDAPVYSLPFLFQDWDEVARVRAQVDPLLAAGFEEEGIRMLGLTGVGFAYFMGSKPIRTQQDWQQLKLWTPQNDTIAARVFDLAGVDPVPLSIGDVFTGLQTGMIDTVANTPAGTVALQWHGKVKHMADVPLTFVVAYMVLDDRAWKRLSPADQQVVARAFAAAATRMDANARRDDAAALEAMKKQGLQVSTPAPAEAARWRALGTQVTTDMEADRSLSPEILAAIRKALAEGGTR